MKNAKEVYILILSLDVWIKYSDWIPHFFSSVKWAVILRGWKIKNDYKNIF